MREKNKIKTSDKKVFKKLCKKELIQIINDQAKVLGAILNKVSSEDYTYYQNGKDKETVLNIAHAIENEELLNQKLDRAEIKENDIDFIQDILKKSMNMTRQEREEKVKKKIFECLKKIGGSNSVKPVDEDEGDFNLFWVDDLIEEGVGLEEFKKLISTLGEGIYIEEDMVKLEARVVRKAQEACLREKN